MRRHMTLVVLILILLVIFVITPLPLTLLLYPSFGSKVYLWLIVAQVLIIVLCAIYEWRRRKKYLNKNGNLYPGAREDNDEG